MSKEKQLQDIVTRYIEAGRTWPAETRQIAAWAIDQQLWKPHPGLRDTPCADELGRAIRDELIVDPQGRVVRAKHSARTKQGTFWDDMRTASRERMAISLSGGGADRL